jgi:hypothetical protein
MYDLLCTSKICLRHPKALSDHVPVTAKHAHTHTTACDVLIYKTGMTKYDDLDQTGAEQ